jgi:hypothetical protein
MMAARVVLVMSALAVPAIFAPSLARSRGQAPSKLWLICAEFVALSPLLAPWALVGVGSSLCVWLVAIQAKIAMLKTIDFLTHRRPGISLVRARLFLTVLPGLAVEDMGRLIAQTERWQILWRRLCAAIPGLSLGLILTALGQRLDLPSRAILLDSSFKTVEIYLLAGGLNHLLVAAFACAGFRLSDGFRYPIFARSVLDFWCRYDVWIHHWLKRNIFVPLGLRNRKPALAILTVFAYSGVAHEYLFVPVTTDLLGWQFAFFSLHGVAAISGHWLGRVYQKVMVRRVSRPIGVLATLGFVFATAPIFIHCLDRVLDLHRDLGAWVLRMTGYPAA